MEIDYPSIRQKHLLDETIRTTQWNCMGTYYDFLAKKTGDAVVRVQKFWREHEYYFPKKQEGHSWYDLHTHTTFSDGVTSPVEEFLFGRYAIPSLDGLAFTDHNRVGAYDIVMRFLESKAYRRMLEIEPPEKEHFDVLKGIEVSSKGGVHIIGIGVKERIPKDLSWKETIQAIKSQGGLALAPHPYASFPGVDDFRGVDGNFCDPELGFDGVEILNGSWLNFRLNGKTRRQNRRCANPLSEYGGSDSHFMGTVGVAATGFPGRGLEDLKHAFAEKTTYAVGHTWTPLDMAAGLAKYYRLMAKLEKVEGFSDLLRRPSEMLEPMVESMLKNAWRAVRYHRQGGKFPQSSLEQENPQKDSIGKGK